MKMKKWSSDPAAAPNNQRSEELKMEICRDKSPPGAAQPPFLWGPIHNHQAFLCPQLFVFQDADLRLI